MKKKQLFFYNKIFIFFLFSILALLTSCNSTKEKKRINPIETSTPTATVEVKADEIAYLNLSFSGDIMAHDVNYRMKDYNKIYDDVKTILQADDLSFGNVEMPICDELPLSTFPRFNVHSDYLKAAIDAGFDVFSFANNHTNDKKVKGINGTIASIKSFQKEKPVYYSGVKETDEEDIKPILIEKKGWKILFLSITELLNSHDNSKKRVYYSNPNKEGRKILSDKIKAMKEKNPCDIFILSLHLAEAEYGLKVLESKKKWFKTLAENGVDIIWAHHPHVLQSWEVVDIEYKKDNKENTEAKTKKAFFMYSMGNFISGQRWAVNYNNPNYYREYTGDSVLMQVRLKKINNKLSDEIQIKPILITNYNSEKAPVVKLFTPEFIAGLKEKEKKYFQARFELMHKYLPLKEK